MVVAGSYQILLQKINVWLFSIEIHIKVQKGEQEYPLDI